MSGNGSRRRRRRPAGEQLVTQSELAELSGVDVRTIRTWTDEGLPRERGRAGRYPLGKAITWIRERDALATPDTGLDVKQERARFLRARAEIAEYELAQRRGELVTVADHVRLLDEILSRVHAKHLNLPSKWAHECLGLQSLADAQQALTKMMDECMHECARSCDDLEDAPDDPSRL